MDYTAVTNPTYASADQLTVSCMVQFDGMVSPVPFIAHADDPEAHGQQLYTELMALKYGQIGPYVAPAQTPGQLYSAAIAKGVSVVSGSTPALNATYGVAESDTADITSEATFIFNYQEFTNGAQTFGWPDQEGLRHTFPSTASFLQFAKAVAVYVSACKQAYAALASGTATDFPSNIVLIG